MTIPDNWIPTASTPLGKHALHGCRELGVNPEVLIDPCCGKFERRRRRNALIFWMIETRDTTGRKYTVRDVGRFLLPTRYDQDSTAIIRDMIAQHRKHEKQATGSAPVLFPWSTDPDEHREHLESACKALGYDVDQFIGWANCRERECINMRKAVIGWMLSHDLPSKKEVSVAQVAKIMGKHPSTLSVEVRKWGMRDKREYATMLQLDEVPSTNGGIRGG